MTTDQSLSHSNDERAVFASGSAMIASRAISAVIGWLGSVTMARTLSPTDWGVYSFIFALLGLMAVVTDLGVGRAVLGRITTDNSRDNQLAAGSFIVLRIIMGLIGYAIAFGYSAIIGQPLAVSGLVLFAGIVIILSTPANALLVLYQSRLHLAFVAKWDIIAQVVQLALILLIAATAPSVAAFIVAPIIREVIVLVARWRGIKAGKLPELAPLFSQPTFGWAETLKESIPISIGYALFLLLTKVDQLMLERMIGYEPVGIYAIAYKFSDLLGMTITALALPFTTVLVTSYVRDHATFTSHTRRAFVAAATLSALAVVGFLPTADGLISLLYGTDFASAGLPSRLLIVAAGFSGVSTVALAVLLAAKKLRGFPVAALIALGVKIALNLDFIPRWGMNGAAVATVITEGALMLATLGLVVTQVKVPRLIPGSALAQLTIVVASISYPLLLLTFGNHLNWIIAGFIAVAFFGLFLWLSKSWPFDSRGGARAAGDDKVRYVDNNG